MRREYLYLQDILDACDVLQTFLEEMDSATFLSSELHKAATLQKLTVIGEAASRFPPPAGISRNASTDRMARYHRIPQYCRPCILCGAMGYCVGNSDR